MRITTRIIAEKPYSLLLAAVLRFYNLKLESKRLRSEMEAAIKLSGGCEKRAEHQRPCYQRRDLPRAQWCARCAEAGELYAAYRKSCMAVGGATRRLMRIAHHLAAEPDLSQYANEHAASNK